MGNLLVVIGNSLWPLSIGILIWSAHGENIILVYIKETNVSFCFLRYCSSYDTFLNHFSEYFIQRRKVQLKLRKRLQPSRYKGLYHLLLFTGFDLISFFCYVSSVVFSSVFFTYLTWFRSQKKLPNRPLPSSKNPLLSKWGQVHSLSCEDKFYLHEYEKSFPYQRLGT